MRVENNLDMSGEVARIGFPLGKEPAGDFGTAQTPAAERIRGELCKGVFLSDYHVEQVAGAHSPARFTIFCDETNSMWRVGATELTIARLFDGVRTYDEIAATLRSDHRINISTEKLKVFEERLIKLGLLRGGPDEKPPFNPLTSFNFGWLQPLLVIRLLRLRPEPMLTRLLHYCPWLVSSFMLWIGVGLSLIGAGIVLSDYQRFSTSAVSTISSWWLVWTYVIICLSGIFHEGGHALCCKAFKTRVHEVGFMIYFLVPFAWTTPNQRDWDQLKSRERVMTILAGPLGSLALAGPAAILWRLSPPESFAQHFGSCGVLAAVFGATLTFLPFVNGDGQLLLAEVFHQPNLKRDSFTYLRTLTSKRKRSQNHSLSKRRRVLFLFVALGTLITGWLAVGGIVLAIVLIVWW